MKKTLSILLSLLMVMTTLFALPFTASALPEGQNQIYGWDEFRAWGLNEDLAHFALHDNTGMQEVLPSYKGMSYDEKTNTLTLDNVPYVKNAIVLSIQNMGDITVKVIGNSGLAQLSITDSNVTLAGTGTLTLNPGMTYTRWDEEYVDQHIFDCPVNAQNSSLHLTNTVNLRIENGYEESNSMAFYFNEAKTVKQLDGEVLIYDNKATEKPVWKEEISGGPYYEAVWEDTPYVYHKFPAGKIYYKENSDEENNYYIISSGGSYYDKLVERDGAWFETDDRTEMFYSYNGSYYDSDDNEYPDIYFTEYTDFSSMPESLVKDGYAEAYVSKSSALSDPVYTKDGEDYVFHFTSYYYRKNLDPVIPEAPTGTGSYYVMLKINTLGDYKYLTYVEDIDVYASYDDLNTPEMTDDGKYIAVGKTYDSIWDARDALNADFRTRVADRVAELGYTAKTVYVDRPYNYTYYVTNNQLNFTATAAAPINVSKLTISGIKNKTYTGKALSQSITVKNGSKTLKSGTDYTVSYKNNKNAGTATVTITGKGSYTGSVKKTFKINKAKNTITAKAVAKSVKASKLKKAKQTVKKAITVKKNQGTVTYSRVKKGSSKYLTISNKGVITVKKGKYKKGTTLKIKVKVTAKGNSNYNKASKTVTVKVKIK